MTHRLNVLFIASQPAAWPALSVHATLMRFLDPKRVRVHVLYNRLAAEEPYASSGRSALDRLPRAPEIALIPAEFGPVGGALRPKLAIAAARAVLPAGRDSIRLLAYLRRHRIDVIHCDEGSRNAFYGLVLSKLTSARCIVHFHSKYGSWMLAPSRFAVRHADAVIAVSGWTGDVLAQAGVDRRRIFTVLNGIDLTGWDPEAVDRATVRRRLAIPPEDPLVVMVAQLTAWKRQATLIEAFRTVAAKHPRARLMLVGVDWSPSGSYRAELERQVAAAGLERSVIFAGQRTDVRDLLAAADVFALPSLDDPCPLAEIEAMAMGKPIVAVRAGGAPELIEHGRTGLLGPPDDADQLAANLLRLIDDPRLRHELGGNGRRRARDCFSAERMAEDVEAVYRSVTGDSRA
jgi:glycosyltransferase involved in cell wall biosynthesis